MTSSVWWWLADRCSPGTPQPGQRLTVRRVRVPHAVVRAAVVLRERRQPLRPTVADGVCGHGANPGQDTATGRDQRVQRVVVNLPSHERKNSRKSKHRRTLILATARSASRRRSHPWVASGNTPGHTRTTHTHRHTHRHIHPFRNTSTRTTDTHHHTHPHMHTTPFQTHTHTPTPTLLPPRAPLLSSP